MFALNNLAMGLVTRFDLLRRPKDLNEAISLARESGALQSNVLRSASESALDNVSIDLLYLTEENANQGYLSWTTSPSPLMPSYLLMRNDQVRQAEPEMDWQNPSALLHFPVLKLR